MFTSCYICHNSLLTGIGLLCIAVKLVTFAGLKVIYIQDEAIFKNTFLPAGSKR